jgi:hypothetical protein
MKFTLLLFAISIFLFVSCSDDDTTTCTNAGKESKCTISNGSDINYDFESWSFSRSNSTVNGLRTTTLVSKSKTSDCNTEYQIMTKRVDFEYDSTWYDLSEAYLKIVKDGDSDDYMTLVSGRLLGYESINIVSKDTTVHYFFNYELTVKNDNDEEVVISNGIVHDDPDVI